MTSSQQNTSDHVIVSFVNPFSASNNKQSVVSS